MHVKDTEAVSNFQNEAAISGTKSAQRALEAAPAPRTLMRNMESHLYMAEEESKRIISCRNAMPTVPAHHVSIPRKCSAQATPSC